MQRVQIRRTRRPSGRPGVASDTVLPTGPASDTSSAVAVLERIERALADR